MELKEFYYDLPEDLIAQKPLRARDNSRLLIMDKENWNLDDKVFTDLVEELWENDVLVINKTRVLKARLKWKVTLRVRKTEREVEVFLHKEVWENTWDCIVYPWKRFSENTIISFYDENDIVVMTWEVQSTTHIWRIIKFTPIHNNLFDTLEQIWNIPLPPYIKNDISDSERYQTVYNDNIGSVAAPTAGLHFTDELLRTLKNKWVKIEKVLLHVWLGTFGHVRETEEIEKHQMHSEYIELEDIVANRLNAYKTQWRRIIAVWTTSIRVLESFSDDDGVLHSGQKETDIFIYPGYEWKFVESLITNFHLPESTLLMLVSSLAGQENIKKAYRHAIGKGYRFFSFWDAMWIK